MREVSLEDKEVEVVVRLRHNTVISHTLLMGVNVVASIKRR